MQTHLLLFLFCAAAAAGAAGTASPDELRALMEFRKGITSDPLGKLSNSWKVSSSDPVTICPNFYGISCDENGVVTSINLDRIDLAGDIKFSTLFNLKNLRNLSLSGNRLTGRLVPALGSMYSIQYLDLSGNQFYGPIPARINDLYALNYLNLSNNNFTGGFPVGIQNLQQLAVLDLHSNYLWGDLGLLFSELRNVQYVDLSDNAFYGSLDMDNGNGNVPSVVNTVQYVNLSNNRLGGGFFSGDALVLFRNLHVLDLSGNELNGKLPLFWALPNLEVLRLSNAQLFGPIPEDLLESFIPLKELDLSRNGFSGSIPKLNSTSLITLNLSSNELSGILPPSLGNCQIVDLSNNLLSDDVSVFETWESPLQVLDLSSNKLIGNFPNLTTHFSGLISLNLGNNSLKGSVPPILLPNLVFLDLRRNELDGQIPPGLFTSMTLNHLDLSNNQFTGPIPLHGSQEKSLLELSSYPPMVFLDLSYNTLTGSLSSDIGNFRMLRLLNLGNDGLSGELPTELTNLSQLEFLDLSNNRFNGKIPDKLSPELKFLNMSGNDLSGKVPENLKNFSDDSFHPGNPHLNSAGSGQPSVSGSGYSSSDGRKGHKLNSSMKIAIIAASVVTALMIAFVLLAYYRAQIGDFRVKTAFGGQPSLTSRDIKNGISSRPTTSLSFSNAHLLTSNSRSLSGQSELGGDIVESPVLHPAYAAASSASEIPNLIDTDPTPSGRKSSPDSPVASSPRFVETIEQQVTLDVYSPDRFAGQLFFFDPRPQLSFTAEDLSRAPAEILGRSSHGTLYKATLGGGHMLTVKWLRVGLTKDKKEFAKEIKKIGTMNHPNVVRLVAYYWGPREQERLTLANYIEGDSLALHLYETTPRRYSLLSFNQRLKVAIDVARGLSYLHGRGIPHGNLKPTNIILEGPQYDARLTDFGLHRLMTPAGIAEQILNLGALGYRAPELANAPKPVPSFKADVYAFGVILMELLTRRSAGDIISGQSGAVDLTDWVRLCDQEGRGMDCIDRDIAGGEQQSKAMDDLLEVSLRCILPLTERPTVRQILEDLCAISV